MNTATRRAVICLFGAFVVAFLAQRLVAENRTSSLAAPAEAAQGNDGGTRRECSTHTLRGAYGLKLEGFSPIGPFASASQVVFVAMAESRASRLEALNGHIVERAVGGEYRVNPDCRGFIVIPSEVIPGKPHQARGDFVLVDGGREFFIIDNEEGWVLNGMGKKL